MVEGNENTEPTQNRRRHAKGAGVLARPFVAMNFARTPIATATQRRPNRGWMGYGKRIVRLNVQDVSMWYMVNRQQMPESFGIHRKLDMGIKSVYCDVPHLQPYMTDSRRYLQHRFA